jgi:hypothetical protein
MRFSYSSGLNYLPVHPWNGLPGDTSAPALALAQTRPGTGQHVSYVEQGIISAHIESTSQNPGSGDSRYGKTGMFLNAAVEDHYGGQVLESCMMNCGLETRRNGSYGLH